MSGTQNGRAELLSPFNPSPTALLDVMSRRLDDSMLREIAEADYGAEADVAERELRRIRETRQITGRIPGILLEVLELSRWSHPEDPKWAPGSTGVRGHIMRGFCCAALLRAAAEPENAEYIPGENQTVAQLVASALVLGPEVQEAAASLLAWRLRSSGIDAEDRPFFAMGLLILAVFMGTDPFREDELNELADWVVREEADARATLGRDGKEGWLLGLTIFNQAHPVWRSLAQGLLAESSKIEIPEVRSKLESIGSKIVRAPKTGSESPASRRAWGCFFSVTNCLGLLWAAATLPIRVLIQSLVWLRRAVTKRRGPNRDSP